MTPDAVTEALVEAIDALKFYMDGHDGGQRARKALARLAIVLNHEEHLELSLSV